MRLSTNTWFRVVSWIIILSRLNTVRQPRIESIINERAKENMGIPDDVCSHHDNGCEDDIGQDDVVHSDEGFDVDELMRNVAPDVLLQRRNKSFDNFEMLDKALRDLLY
jgi:hypothetical protein